MAAKSGSKVKVATGWMRPEELARLFNVHVETIRRACLRNDIPAYKIPGGRALMIPRAWYDSLAPDVLNTWVQLLEERNQPAAAACEIPE